MNKPRPRPALPPLTGFGSAHRRNRSADTQVRILDAAEQLLAERGIEAASMRAVTALAKANLAAVNYHFGSKEALVVAVFARRLRPVNEERLRLLDAFEAANPGGAPRLDEVLVCFVGPVIRLAHDQQHGGERFMRLLGRALYEPGSYLTQLFKDEMEPVLERFTGVLRRILPGLSDSELFWRMHFAGGAIAYTLAQMHRLALQPDSPPSKRDPEQITRGLVEFIAAGMRGEHVPPPLIG
jgi:AcrR family transcriptional regulator